MNKVMRFMSATSLILFLAGCEFAVKPSVPQAPDVQAPARGAPQVEMVQPTVVPVVEQRPEAVALGAYFFKPLRTITVDSKFSGSVDRMDYQLVQKTASGKENVVVQSFYGEMWPKDGWLLEDPEVLASPKGETLVLWNAHKFESDATEFINANLYDLKKRTNTPLRQLLGQSSPSNDYTVSPNGRYFAYLNCPPKNGNDVCDEIRVIDLVAQKEINKVVASTGKSFAQSYVGYFIDGGFRSKMTWSSDSASLTVGEYPLSDQETWNFGESQKTPVKIDIVK